MQALQEPLTAEQRLLLEGLESHPKLMSRFLSILSLAEEPDMNGTVRSADEVEAILIDQVRKLGQESMESWASKVDAMLREQSRQEDPSVQLREKKL
jgi:hypothetical protein